MSTDPGVAYVAGSIFALLHSDGYDVTPTEEADGLLVRVKVLGDVVYEVRVARASG